MKKSREALQSYAALSVELNLLAAGLPVLPSMADESKSYAEGLFNFADVGALSEADATKALRYPVRCANVDFAI